MVDLIVKLLRLPTEDVDEQDIIRIFTAAFGVLHTYLMGPSRRNKLYFLKYLDFFQTQFIPKVCTTYLPYWWEGEGNIEETRFTSSNILTFFQTQFIPKSHKEYLLYYC